jgi:DNA-binding beta-propeller fold protein YncE
MRVHLLPLPRPYSVEWRGKIDAPRSGLYRFATDSADASWVYLDDQLVVTNDGAPRQGREGSIRLEAGFHDLRVRFRDETGHTFIQVYWTPPDGNRELLPTDRLHPPQGSYPPPLQLPVAQTPPAQARAPARLQSGSVKLEYAGSIGAGSLGDPRDVAVSADGHAYVVDTAAKRVVIFNPDGSPAGQLAGDFAQPFGVAVSPDGKVTVLDSLGQDPVLRFGPQGELLSRLGGSAGCYSPRGLFVDSAGSVYLADTGRGRILKLDASGRVAGQFRGGGRLAQPVSVAVDPNGVLYVVDGEKQELMVIAPDDTFRRSWLISPATTFDAVHLTLGPKGEIYVSDPNGGTIMIYDAQGNVIGQVGTRGSGEGQFSLPTGVQVDAQGRLWVADTRNKRVQQWAIR